RDVRRRDGGDRLLRRHHLAHPTTRRHRPRTTRGSARPAQDPPRTRHGPHAPHTRSPARGLLRRARHHRRARPPAAPRTPRQPPGRRAPGRRAPPMTGTTTLVHVATALAGLVALGVVALGAHGWRATRTAAGSGIPGTTTDDPAVRAW